ncbi:MAG: tRNA 2-thiouridine(34) synthase MnmA [Atopobiaceae bacterium]|jgi:tRNA-specific 2-thiouridylase|nr:tRNA 2-thiouridine(34) synthase MnmA [Atopobiaceae bacterium]MCI1318836.1 tRNA 2-thiouridine(34) synthase MnmA [Atopobiaceae bacterium]MCI1389740.1 tRNA 2-thiouridine(34) synthase MnmA [Atopobiaceae bacterium]MCI1432722.1 tRNA 2-thiouridine(34) synthase MnmA [Atopobiaceae bacterium]MCI1470941.1 tRNA 2-thiouridine(34) synthase MnmA [Atopobiaceae bacterium]
MTGRVAVAMSGGVDSSVAALIASGQAGGVAGAARPGAAQEAQAAGRAGCVGVTMVLAPPRPASEEAAAAGMPTDDAYEASLVAAQLGIDHEVLDLGERFRKLVVRRFVEEYEHGLTPNPCVVCNRTVKFGLLLDAMREMGCDVLVTGHYARIERDEATGRLCVARAADPLKDQSYFLHVLSQDVLAHVWLPLGALTKPQVRAIASEHGLVSASRPESQDICFLPDGDYAAFVERAAGAPLAPGPIVDEQGHVLGRHRGLARYTQGQRKGIGLGGGALAAAGTQGPLYVVGKDVASNTLVVGPDEHLMHDVLELGEVVWGLREAEGGPFEASVVTCYHGTPHRARVVPTGEATARVELEDPVRAPAPGQSAVAYVGDRVAMGGTIQP